MRSSFANVHDLYYLVSPTGDLMVITLLIVYYLYSIGVQAKEHACQITMLVNLKHKHRYSKRYFILYGITLKW